MLPSPHRRNAVPRYQPRKSSSRCCCKCICLCCCLLFIIVLALGGMAFYIYAVYKPKIPSYRVNGLEVKKFDVQSDFSLKTVFTVSVTADNPNTNIGFKYGKDSSVIVTYTDSILCSGKLPSFHQKAENVTEMKIQLDGVSKFGSGLQEAFQESKDTGKIPLLVKVKTPVKVVVGSLSLREAIVYVNCSLVVDKLQPGKKVGIVKSNYSFDVSF
ncbi:unnamed protein product [Cuscuta campestris]|uniref:Uncharacterized protein n=1 Tax=Cuscuta campestris TaxID=132261 RepID=A0A484MB20_9ASTE|nr:unnamed protein product [Cuscuta campestris]